MRQMPQGQWVAFENNEPHDCEKPSLVEIVRPAARKKARQIEAPTEFDDIAIPDHNFPQPKPVLQPVEPSPSRPMPTTPSPAKPISGPGLNDLKPHPATNLRNAPPDRATAKPAAPQVTEPVPRFQPPDNSFGWFSGGMTALATVYMIIGVFHSIAFSLFVSRATCATTTKSLVYIFCNTGMGISHFITVIGWPWYWL
jgi:hypothetical protein